MSCAGSVAAGINLTAPMSVFVRNANGCATVAGSTLTVSPSSLATASPSSSVTGAWTLEPTGNGTGTVTVAAPGYAPLSVPLTVELGVLDLTNQ